MSEVKSFFVPDSALQGESFPLHVSWRGRATVTVELPEGLEAVEVFNAEPGGVEARGRSLVVKGAVGYLGLVLKSRVYEDPVARLEVRVELDGGGWRESLKGSICLVRPQLIVDAAPTIKVSGGELLDRVRLANRGLATALVYLSVSEGSEVALVEPRELSALSRLAPELPEWHRGLRAVVGFYEKARLGRLPADQLAEELRRLDEELYAVNAEGIAELLDRPTASPELRLLSALWYLGSTGRRIVLVNPPSNLKVPEGRSVLRAALAATDLAYNRYPPIPLEVEFISDGEAEVPLTSLFDL